MHTLSSSYQNTSALNLPHDHPFRTSLPPRLLITADGDIVSAVPNKPGHRHAIVVDGTPLSPTNTDLDDTDLSPTARPASVLSTSSMSSRASTFSTASVASTSATSPCSTCNVSSISDGSTSKLVHILGSDLPCNLNSETVDNTVATHCPSPREVIKAVLSKKLRTGKT